jgi:hypothetical protein
VFCRRSGYLPICHLVSSGLFLLDAKDDTLIQRLEIFGPAEKGHLVASSAPWFLPSQPPRTSIVATHCPAPDVYKSSMLGKVSGLACG